MQEKKVNESEVLNGGVIEMFKLEGLFYVKSTVNGLVKFSDCVSKSMAEFLLFNAKFNGNLDF